MVFEKFVVQFLDTYVSKYIDNLDYKKLNIDLWNGNVTLENLSIKSNALADFNLPISIKFGYLEKLILQIPWTHLYTQPTKVTINGLYFIIVPKLDLEYDREKEELEQHQTKMKRIENIEKLRTEQMSNEINDDNDTFTARMRLQIVQNLELSIHNIHIVYEDRITKPQHPFAFGITLNSMSFHTTNKDWEPTIVQEKTPIHYKFAELNALAIYWNSNAKLNSDEILNNLKSKIVADNQHLPVDMSYIFRPLNIKAKLIMTLKPRQLNFTKPMFHITIDLDHINLNLARSQYLDILDLLDHRDYLMNKTKYLKYQQNSRWKLAYNAIVDEIIRPKRRHYQWETIRKHRCACREYRSIYYQGLCENITKEDKERAEVLERQLDEFNLLFIRQCVQIEVKKRKQQEPKSLFENISNWWYRKPKETKSEFHLETMVSDEEKRKFYEMIGYQGEDISSLTYPKEFVDIDLNIQLNMLDLNIWSIVNDQNLKIITQMSLSNTEFAFRRRPAISSVLFDLNLTSFHVTGYSPDANQPRPILIQPILANNTKLLQVEFQINPTEKQSGYRLQLISQSLEIKYHSPTINKLIEYFRKTSEQNLQGIKQAAYTKYTDLKNQSIIMIKSNVDQIDHFDIFIDLQSSYLLLPRNGIYDENTPVICIDMGHFVFQTIKPRIQEKYTQFRLELNNFQLLYSIKNDNNRLNLIQPITLSTDIFKCIESNSKHYPLWKISGQIPDVTIRVSDMKLIQLVKHIESIKSSMIVLNQTDSHESLIKENSTGKILEITEQLIEHEDRTQLETNFEILKIDLILEEEKINETQSFLHISFISICFQSYLKTFDIEFQASLNNLIISHEKFFIKTKQCPRILSSFEEINSKLVSIYFLHTSSTNPRFSSLKYNGIENHIQIHLNKFIFELKLEIFLSIMKFQQNFMEKWSTEFVEQQEKQMVVINSEKSVEKNRTTVEIQADLQEFRLIISTVNNQMFDVHVQGVKGKIQHRLNQTNIDLILNNFYLFDSNTDAKYRRIICQQNGDKDLLNVSINIFSYSSKHIKSIDDLDCIININFSKANIILLYKHVDQLMNFLELLNLSKIIANRADLVYEQIQKLQDQAFKLRFNAIFHAPNIIVPINSISNQGFFLDLGKINLQTKFIDDPQHSLIEQQEISVENVSASRIQMNDTHEITSEIVLFNCAQSNLSVNRLLYPETVENTPPISIKMHWGVIHFQLAKDDYLCGLRVAMENFNDQTKTNIIKENEDMKIAVFGQPKESNKEKYKIRVEFEKLALTLYTDQPNLIDRHVQHNPNSKLAHVELESLDIIFRQFSNNTYKFIGRIKDFRCDDLRETHRTDAVVRLIDRHRSVEPDAYMFIASLDLESKKQRRINVQVESLSICIKLDYLLNLYEFFIENLPTQNNSTTSSSNSSNSCIETQLDFLIKNPEIILLENQYDYNSNCLVLNFGLYMRLVQIQNNMNIICELKELTMHISNFKELKLKSRILQPTKINFVIVRGEDGEKYSIDTSNLFVNISPTTIQLLMNVMNSFGNRQTVEQIEDFDVQTIFDYKSINDTQFWFLENEDDKQITSNEKKRADYSQLLFLSLKTIEVKVDIDFEFDTKSVVAMCLSDVTANLKNWSNQFDFSSNLNLEAALYNENTLTWEPLIEPIPMRNCPNLSPWNFTCSITSIANRQQSKFVLIKTDQLLNLTITKTGLKLLTNLFSSFTNFDQDYQVKIDANKNKSMLELINFTGQSLFLNHFKGLSFTDDQTWTSMVVEPNQSIALTPIINPYSYRLSVIEQQTSVNQQEFTLQINNSIKKININHTYQRIYNLDSTSSSVLQIVSDTQINHNQRRVILRSIVKIINHTLLPIIIIDFDEISGKNFHRIENKQDFYVPIDLIHNKSNSSSIFISIYKNEKKENLNDFIVFDWLHEEIKEENLQLNNDEIHHLIFYKEIQKAYSENTNQLDQNSYCIHIYSPVQLTNLLPIHIQYRLNESKQKVLLKSNDTQPITCGNKRSVFDFIIPSYNNCEWKSERFKLDSKKDKRERMIIFRHGEMILRIIVRMEIIHESYRLIFYAPFWLLNHTYSNLRFRIQHERIDIPTNEKSVLICPDNYSNDSSQSGELALENGPWSDKFSLDVIQNIGMISCKGSNDKTYMICVDIRTSSFGLTKLITLFPAMVVINLTPIPLEIVEGNTSNQWTRLESDSTIPFWPVNPKDNLMTVRYIHNRIQSKAFFFNKNHQTLLHVNDKGHPVISVEVIVTEFNGIRVIFSNYKPGDAPVLIINQTEDQLISFAQKDEKEIQYLVPQQFVYYTWTNPTKSRELSIANNDKTKSIKLNPTIGSLDGDKKTHYAIFIDDVQTVLLFSNDFRLIRRVFNLSPSSNQSRLRIHIPNCGLSIINDKTREELIYFSLNRSKYLWTETKQFRMIIHSHDQQTFLNHIYQKYLQTKQINYSSNEYPKISVAENSIQLINQQKEQSRVKRQRLHGLAIEYTWSNTQTTLYARINRLQIDNQLNYTIYPCMLYPKGSDTDDIGRAFVELSVCEKISKQSKIRHIQYCKLLIQEFAFRIDQDLIISFLNFFKEDEEEQNVIINMDNDIKYLEKTFQTKLRKPIEDKRMYFENLHLSPLKIHVSFTLSGKKSIEDLFVKSPFVGHLLQTLNIVDVQDVVLRICFFEKISERCTQSKLLDDILTHYQNQLLKQIHVLILGLNILGNPLGIIRGFTEGVESLFYEPIQGAIEGPVEFVEGIANGVISFVGSTVGSTAGALSKITGVIGMSLAKLSFDEKYQNARIRRKGESTDPMTDVANEGRNAAMACVHGLVGIVKKPIDGAKHEGAAGFFKGVGKGLIGALVQPASGAVDFASTSLGAVKRVAKHERTIPRIRYPRYISPDGLIRPYIPHEAMGLYILHRLKEGKYAKTDSYVAHITCSTDPFCWLMATSKRLFFIQELSIFDQYEIQWIINYSELQKVPSIRFDTCVIEILTKERQSIGKLVECLDINDARYLIEKIENVMSSLGLK